MTIKYSRKNFAIFLFALPAVAVFSVNASPACLADEPDSKVKTEEVKIEDITLAIPESWEQKPPSNRLRLAQFDIPKAEGDSEGAEVVVSMAGGSVQANVERWIAQFQREDREAKLTEGTCPQGDYIFVDITGTYKKPIGPPIAGKYEDLPNARMLGVILNVKGKGNYFLKLAGPNKTVSTAAKQLRDSFGGNEKDEKEFKLGGAT